MLYPRILRHVAYLFLIVCISWSCQPTSKKSKPTKPKLVVGIVVDQMRYDYLERFAQDFAFNRLMKEGQFYENCRYSYLPTYTGPGHATIFTGTLPKYHGIIANDWYERNTGKMMYCASDSTVSTLGSPSGAGQMSPKNMQVSSLGDAFKQQFGAQSKVYGVSLKDRGAIFPAGKTADMAFWFDGGKQGKWISSSYYGDSIPSWAQAFNSNGLVDTLLQQKWEPLSATLHYNLPDTADWERPFRGLEHAVFPYELSKLALINGDYSLLKQVPQGNDLSIAFAQDLITHEGLGKDSICDFLSLSFSATDYVGHRFGTESLELVDTYLRLDQSLAGFLSFLDVEVGEGNYTVFLSADHGATPPAGYSQAQYKRGGAISTVQLETALDSVLVAQGFAKNTVLALANQQVYLSEALGASQKEKALSTLTEYLKQQQFVAEILPTSTLGKGVPGSYKGKHYTAATNAYMPSRCGDLWYFLKPYWVEYATGGSTHGSFEESDIHVPFMVMGPGIFADTVSIPTEVRDIAPVVCKLNGIQGLETFTGRATVE